MEGSDKPAAQAGDQAAAPTCVAGSLRGELPITTPPWSPAGWVVVAIVFIVGFLNFPLQFLGTVFDHLPGDGADNRLNNFILEHGYRWLTGREASFWDAPAFHPKPGATAWSDAHIGMLPIYASARFVGVTPEQGYQTHYVACFVLNYVATVWALRRLGFGPVGTAAGAFLFTFNLPLASQSIHTQLYPRWLVPPSVVFGWEFLCRPRASKLAALCACGVGQMYLTVYVGYILSLLLGAGLVVTLIRFRNEIPWDELRRPSRREWAKRLGVATAAIAALLPLLAKHGSQVRGTQLEWIRESAPQPQSWLIPSDIAFVSPERGWSPLPRLAVPTPPVEHRLFIGFLPLGCVLVGVWRSFGDVRMGTATGRATAAALTVVLLMLFVTRFGPVWAYEPLLHLPGSRGIRIPARVVLVLTFPAAVALAWGIDSVVKAAHAWGRIPALGVASLLIVSTSLEQRLVRVESNAEVWASHRYPIVEAKAWQAKVADAIAGEPRPRIVYVFPSMGHGLREPLQLQTETMRATQDLGIPCVNGWSGYPPYRWWFFEGYRQLMGWLTDTNRTPPDQLAGLIVVGFPTPDADPVYEATMWVLFPPRMPP